MMVKIPISIWNFHETWLTVLNINIFYWNRFENKVSSIIIIIMIMGTFNARHIYPIGYSRRRCGATTALIRQPQTHPHNEEPEIRNSILWEGVRFLACRRKPECPEKTYQGGHGIGKPNSRTTTGKLHWWKTKCSST